MPHDILFDHDNARFSYRISALIVQRNRVLLQCPVGTQDYAFIGGHVSFGETAKDTLIREIREEIRTDAVIGGYVANMDQKAAVIMEEKGFDAKTITQEDVDTYGI